MGQRHLERAESVLFLSGHSGGPRKVVLDGANIAHGGADGSGLDGRRVISAISEYSSKGYDVIPVFKQETYNYMRHNNNPGFKNLRKLKDEGKLLLFKKKDDHLAISLAIKHNAWLITQDTFKSHSTPRERELHPEWFEDGQLDLLTRGTLVQTDGWVSSRHDWLVVGKDFHDPDIPQIKPIEKFTEIENIARSAREIEKSILKLQLSMEDIDGVRNKQGMKIALGNARKQINDFVDSLPNESRLKLNNRVISNHLKSITITDLKQICKNRDIKGYSSKGRKELSLKIKKDIKNRGLYVHYDSTKTIHIIRERVVIGSKSSVEIMRDVNEALAEVAEEEYAYWYPGA